MSHTCFGQSRYEVGIVVPLFVNWYSLLGRAKGVCGVKLLDYLAPMKKQCENRLQEARN
jgi:hypothetical protein